MCVCIIIYPFASLASVLLTLPVVWSGLPQHAERSPRSCAVARAPLAWDVAVSWVCSLSSIDILTTDRNFQKL